MLKHLLFFCTVFLVSAVQAAPQQPPYDLIVPPVAVQNKEKVEVVELFWYSCPHCYAFEPFIKKWLAKKPDDVEFIRMPAVFANNRFLPLAKAYYTAQALGILDKVHEDFFRDYHDNNKRFTDTAQIMAFFKKHGVAEKDFENAYNSFGVETNIRRARSMSEKYGINAVPTIVVQGKYRLVSEKADGYVNMMGIIDSLIAIERDKIQAKKK